MNELSVYVCAALISQALNCVYEALPAGVLCIFLPFPQNQSINFS